MDLPSSKRREYLRKRLYGCDIDSFALEIARLRLTLVDVPNPNGWNLQIADIFYENLLYTCRSCNSAKSDQIVPDPGKTAYGKCVTVHPDGTIEALNEDGEILIETLRLNNEDIRGFAA